MTARTCWLAGAGAAALTTVAAQIGLHGRLFAVEWGLALILTLTQGAISLWINVRALGAHPDRFFVWAIGAQGLRIFLLVGVLGIAFRFGMEHFAPFLAAVLTGYVVMMVAEIWNLHSGSIRQAL